MKKILIIGDSPSTPTGFSVVINNIFKNLIGKYEIYQLGINYYGDPHQIGWPIYPASISQTGDLWGLGRLKEFVNKDIDLIFILNDVWVIARYLREFKKLFEGKTIPKIVTYFPVDSEEFDSDWFIDFDIVTQAIVYTKFGYDTCKLAAPDLDFKIIFHGVNRKDFFKIEKSKSEIKKVIYPKKPEFYDNSFIVLNANRNQPRKKIDITLEGFYHFAKNKPENVKLHLHMGLRDAGYDITKLSRRFGIENRLIVTNQNKTIQTVPTEVLNTIYNATDVGVNTSWGEGWGLVNVEHAITGAPQIVPDNSACRELFKDVGILMPIYYETRSTDTMTKSGLVHPESLANGLEVLYKNKDIRKSMGENSIKKFSSPEYDWENISEQFREVFEKCLH